MKWLIWALVLMAQTGATTWASRARNSGSVRYHSLASVFSNGVWFISFTILTDSVLRAAAQESWSQWIKLFLFYTTFTVTGASISHYLSMTYLEKGDRRVGA
jgi:hypothetical protein